MRAVVYEGPGKFSLTELPTPEAPEDGLLLRVKACGLGSADLMAYRGEISLPTGRVLGYQIAGEVESMGPSAKAFEVGDRLAVTSYCPCGRCDDCRKGRRQLCQNMRLLPKELSGGLAEYIALPGWFLEEGCVAKIPRNVSFEEAAVAEPASAVLRCQQEQQVGPEDVVLILGCGPAGCMHTQIAKLRGAKKIIQADLLASKMEMARPFMADVLVNASVEDLEEIVMGETDGLGADVVMVAAPSSKALAQGLRLAAKGGRVVLFARYGDGREENMPVELIQRRELSLWGSGGFSVGHLQEVLRLTSARRLTLKWLVTGRISLEEVEKGMASIEAGKELKIVVIP